MGEAKSPMLPKDTENGPLLSRYQDSMESKRVRFLPVLELLLPTLAIFYLLWYGDREPTEAFNDYLRHDQSTIQIIVQVLSHALAMLQISSICVAFNFSTRFRLLHQSISLQDLNLWAALSTARLDPNLPGVYLAIASAFVAATFLPGALWAGALSPMFVLKTQELGQHPIPAFTNRTRVIWDSQFQLRGPQVWNINDGCVMINDERGLVPSCPIPTLQGPLLLSASEATILAGSARKHSKLDNPNWQYIGRSFGIGSSVGLANGFIPDEHVLHNSYAEVGYVAKVSCIKNSTSDFRFRLVDYTNRDVSPSEYQNTHHPEIEFDHSFPEIKSELSTYFADGYLPNSIMGAPELFPVISWHKDYENIATWAAGVNNNRNMIAVAAGTNMYQELNQTQCEVFFTPMTFTVTVNRSKRSIAVMPQPSAETEDIEPTGRLQANVIHSLNLLSRMSASLYVSVLGETLSRNVERMQKQKPQLNLTEAVTSAVEESFTAIIDDILVAYGASQVSNALDTTFSTANGVVETVQIGQPFYRYLVFALNSLIFLLVGFEMIHTGGWHGLPRFNYLDIKSLAIAFSAGGSSIAQAVWDKHLIQGTNWVGDPSDPIACATMVELDLQRTMDETETLAIVKAGDSETMFLDEAQKADQKKSASLVRGPNSRALFHSKSK